MAGKSDKRKYRSAKTGQYVKKSTAKRSPDTTVGETDKKRKRRK